MNAHSRFSAALAVFACLASLSYSQIVTFRAAGKVGFVYDELAPSDYTPRVGWNSALRLEMTFDPAQGEAYPDGNGVVFPALTAIGYIGETRIELGNTGSMSASAGVYPRLGEWESVTFGGRGRIDDAEYEFNVLLARFGPPSGPFPSPGELPPLSAFDWADIEVYETYGDGWLHGQGQVERLELTTGVAAPEPSTYGLAAGVVLLGLAWLRRRRISRGH